MDEYAARSQRACSPRSARAASRARSCRSTTRRATLYAADDGVREDSTPENLAKLKPFFDRKYGNVTAGNSSQVTDGARVAGARLRRAPSSARSRRRAAASSIRNGRRSIPRRWDSGPCTRPRRCSQRHRLGLNDVDAWEINEAFAAQVLACLRAWQDEHSAATSSACRARSARSTRTSSTSTAARSRSAIRSAHRARASCCTCSNVLERTGGRRGIAAICIGGGQGGAMLVERVVNGRMEHWTARHATRDGLAHARRSTRPARRRTRCRRRCSPS